MKNKGGIRRINAKNFACDSCNSIFRVDTNEKTEKIKCPNCKENVKLEDLRRE